MTKDSIKMKARWIIDKFKDPEGEIAELLRSGMPMEDAIKKYNNRYLGRDEVDGNLALLEGLYLLCGLISGIDTTSARWDNANARIGVGNSNTAASATQTGLLGASKTFRAMDTGFPQRASSASSSPQFLVWRATFGSADANYAWEEYTVVNAADDTGVNLNRRVENKGTKVSGETWTLNLRIDFS